MEYKIDSNFHDTRLDKFIRRKYEGVNLTSIFKMIRKGKIKVNGKKIKQQNHRLQEGDIVDVYIFGGETKEKELLKLSAREIDYVKKGIVYEDEKILIFNKAANMVMHKGSGHDYGLSEMLKAFLENSDFTFINRIDKATSGLIVGAKNLPTTRELSEEMRERRIEKKYYILVDGVIKEDEFEIKSFLKKTETQVVELDEYEDGAKESISYFKVISRGQKRTLLEGKLGTGRTHQLRVHLANRGNPIVGDQKYGKGESKEMCLFSHSVDIEKMSININLSIPNQYKEILQK